MAANDCAVDLVVCDWNMPDKTGFEFLREIRMTHPDLPFLMVIARADTGSVQDAVDAGVTLYLRKSFSSNEMQTKTTAMFSKKNFCKS